MLMLKRYGSIVLAATTLAMGLSVLTMPAAQAGSLGSCQGHRELYYAEGWCDGTGPEYTYQVYVTCTVTGRNYYGATRWAGDRRQSVAGCPAGAGTAFPAWIQVRRNGVAYTKVYLN